ncbi:MAG: type VI secretion system contractile sheath large subunit [Myxococcota bacterium]
MTSIEEKRAAASVRWLLVAPLESGKSEPFSLDRENFGSVMEEAALTASVTVPDRVGASGTRSFDLTLPSLKAFSLKELIGSVEEFQKLLVIAAKFGKGQLSPEDGIAEIEKVVGAGQLTKSVAEIAGIGIEASTPDGEKKTSGDGGVDAILSEAEVADPSASSAVSSFISNVRKSGGGSKTVKKAGRGARDAIEEAVYGMAKAVLASEEVASLERTWRGLKLLSDQCGQSAGILLEVQDAPVDEIADRLRERPETKEFDSPDGVFVPYEIDSLELLGELANIGEGMLAPVVAAVAPGTLGAATHAGLLDRLDEEQGWDEWNGLRGEESTRWLTMVANRVVLRSEGAGAAKRSVIGNGVYALGAMLSKSFGGFGSFAKVVGKPGSLKAPGMHTIESGRHEGVSCPTEAFFSIRAQTQLGKRGITGLGSGRNEDRIVLTEVKTLRGSDDAVPLPAQILTGRIVRFAQWARDQVPSTASDDDVSNLFYQAAAVFLFPGLESHAGMEANVKEIDGERMVEVHTQVRSEHALVPLDITFALPL